MLVVTLHGETFPYPKYPVGGYDVICGGNIPSADARAYMSNMSFYYFNITYANFAPASNNVVFRPHPQHMDVVAGHYLYNVKCNGC